MKAVERVSSLATGVARTPIVFGMLLVLLSTAFAQEQTNPPARHSRETGNPVQTVSPGQGPMACKIGVFIAALDFKTEETREDPSERMFAGIPHKRHMAVEVQDV